MAERSGNRDPATFTPVRFAVPKGACDCHGHLFGPRARYPFVADRRYTPPDATIAEYWAALRALGIERAVLVAGSIHGTDNSSMLDVMDHPAAGEMRVVVMVDEGVTDAELARFHEQGACGIRTHLKAGGGKPLDPQAFRRMAERIRPMGWHVQVHLDVADFQDVDALFRDYPVPVVIEHMGHMPTHHGVDAPGFQALLRFLARDHAWAKLCGAYINSDAGAPYADVAPFARAIAAVCPDRLVWATNWPHPHQDPIPDDGLLLNLLADWIPDAEARNKVLVDNPARLYGFA